MYKITLGIDGMMYGMSKAHINDAVRNAFPVKKVTSPHSKGRAEILAQGVLDETRLQDVIEKRTAR